MQARRRDESGQPLNERQWLEDEVRCPIAEGRTQFMHDTAIGREREPLVRERWTSDVSAQMFEAGRLARFDSYGSVQAEAFNLRAQLLDDHGPAREGHCRETSSLNSCTWLGAEGGATPDRCGTEERKEPLGFGGHTDVQFALLPHQISAAAETQDPRTNREEELRNFGVRDASGGMEGGSREGVRRGVHTIKHECMKVCVGIERRTIALDLVHCTSAPVLDGIRLRLARVEAKDRPHEHAADGATEIHIESEQVTQSPRERDDPLAHGLWSGSCPARRGSGHGSGCFRRPVLNTTPKPVACDAITSTRPSSRRSYAMPSVRSTWPSA